MIACFDVYYSDNQVTSAALVFDGWDATEPQANYLVKLPASGDEYVAGQFYQRELQPMLAVMKEISESIDICIVDAYCHLDENQSPGLGAYFSESFESPMVTIGVAKNRFRETQHAVEVLRGESIRPLFVTAIGMNDAVAAEHIRQMTGQHRFPEMLKRVDQLSRS